MIGDEPVEVFQTTSKEGAAAPYDPPLATALISKIFVYITFEKLNSRLRARKENRQKLFGRVGVLYRIPTV